MKQGILVYNPRSGKGKAAERALDMAAAWKTEFGSELRLRPTTSLEDIRVAAKETTQNANAVPIFMGGDGTLSESVQGLAEQSNFKPLSTPVGLLPGGTGNSFLMDFGITTYEAAKANLINAIKDNSIQNIDLAVIKYDEMKKDRPDQPGGSVRRITFNIFGIGLIADVTELAIKMRWMGSANYTVASLIKLLSHSPYTFELTMDGKREEVKCNMITIHNSQFTGGAMHIAPTVKVNDGKLFSLVPHFKSRFALLGNFPKIFKGEHVNMPEIRSGFVQSIGIRHNAPLVMNIDGELERGWNPDLTIQPSFWKTYLTKDRMVK